MNILTTILFIIFYLGSISIGIPQAKAITEESTSYMIFVDDGLGFYKVRNLDIPPHKFEYKDHTLSINQGDTVIWQNDAEKTTFTIISEQNLWDNRVGYIRVGSKINYKFESPGIYTFYMKEHTSIRQTIIVNSEEGVNKPPLPKITPTPEITPKETIEKPPPEITPPLQKKDPLKPKINVSDMKRSENKNKIDIKIPIKISPTGIVSIIVTILSIIITFKIGRNKKRKTI